MAAEMDTEEGVAALALRGGRYVVTRVLGEGAQADTLEAVDKQAGRLVAIKRFRVRGARQWKDVELAEREARVLASLSHPRLPAHVEHFEEDGVLYLVMEKIEGESLGALRRHGATLGRDDVVRFLREAAEVLDYLHGRAPPIIHRDIKPNNVIRRPDGSFAFIDFGAVRDRMRPEGGSTVVGTFGYMAPEQFQGRALPGSDVYAVGATALAMLTGAEPEDLPHRGLAIDVPAALGGRADPALTEALTAMLEPDPDRRAPTIGPLLARIPGRTRSERGRREQRPEHERGSRREERRARRREERRERREARAIRRAPLPDREWTLSGLPLLLVLLGLAIARVVVAIALQAAVPLALTILSLVFGRGLRVAARRVREGGRAAAATLSRAQAVVRHGGEGRVRVVYDAPDERARFDDEAARPNDRAAPGEFEQEWVDAHDRERRAQIESEAEAEAAAAERRPRAPGAQTSKAR